MHSSNPCHNFFSFIPISNPDSWELGWLTRVNCSNFLRLHIGQVINIKSHYQSKSICQTNYENWYSMMDKFIKKLLMTMCLVLQISHFQFSLNLGVMTLCKLHYTSKSYHGTTLWSLTPTPSKLIFVCQNYSLSNLN